MSGIVDTNCVLRVRMEEALLIERAVTKEYKECYLNGFKSDAMTLLNLQVKIRKIIKGHKGYEAHDFPQI